ncbi:unnamed protein product [Effrenium voratum]|uniref:Pentatricopeptide repeat-containing protein, chloroplastic n=1 Tax=Effrenium voratum TaxID=2562239 RepID=A0AA36JPB4_9DINO|nr:unnamed protein product [Effrenium voratum]
MASDLIRRLASFRVSAAERLNAVLSAQVKSGQWQLARRSLAVFASSSVRLDSCSLNVASQNAWHQVLCLMSRFEIWALRRDTYSLSTAVKSCANAAAWHRACGLCRNGPASEVAQSALVHACRNYWRRAALLAAPLRPLSKNHRAVANACMAAAGKSSMWQVPLGILTRLTGPKAISYTLAADCRWRISVQLLRAMGRGSVRVDRICLGAVLKAVEEASGWQCCLALLQAVAARGVLPDASGAVAATSALGHFSHWRWALGHDAQQTVNARITACERGTCWAQSLRLLRQMPALAASTDEIGYNSVISACAAARRWRLALGLARFGPANVASLSRAAEIAGDGSRLLPRLLRAAGISYTLRSRLSAGAMRKTWAEWRGALAQLAATSARREAPDVRRSLEACGKGGAWLHALQLTSAAFEAKRTRSCNAVLCALQRTTRCRQAAGLFERMDQMKILPDGASFSAVQANQWQLSLETCRRMALRRLDLDNFMISRAARAASCPKAWLRGLQLAFAAPSRGLAPSPVVRAAAGNAAGSWRRSVGVLRLEDVVSWNTATDACAKGLSWAQALHTTKAMELTRVSPDFFTRSAATAACTRSRVWQQALTLSRLTRERGSAIAMTSVCESVRWRVALGFLQLTGVAATRRDVVVMGAALTACGRDGFWEDACCLLGQMQANKLEPNQVCYTSSLSGCEASLSSPELWRRAVELATSHRVDGIQGADAVLGTLRAEQWRWALEPRDAVGTQSSLCLLPWSRGLALLAALVQRRIGAAGVAPAPARCWRRALTLATPGQLQGLVRNCEMASQPFPAISASDISPFTSA